MKILVLGNQARALVNFWAVLMQHMRDAGHEVICCVPESRESDRVWEEQLRARGYALRHYALDRKGLNPLRDAATAAALFRLFRAEKPHMLFASTIKPVIYGCSAARLAGVPHIFATITGLGYAFEADSLPKKIINKLASTLYRVSLAGAEKIFFQNEDDCQVFSKAGIIQGRHDPRVVLCRGTGVDIEHFAPAAAPVEPPVFLLVGRLLEAKGLPEYAEAARLLKGKYPQARFQVLGPPEQGLGSVPLSQVQAWHDAGDIEYLGQTADVRPFLQAASVLVLPSWREGTPCSIMEGMSVGRAAVVTDAPGCREVVIDKVNGFRVPLRDPVALAGALERFVLEPGLIASMGAASRRMAEEEFDARKVARHILTAMHAL